MARSVCAERISPTSPLTVASGGLPGGQLGSALSGGKDVKGEV